MTTCVVIFRDLMEPAEKLPVLSVLAFEYFTNLQHVDCSAKLPAHGRCRPHVVLCLKSVLERLP